MSSNTAFQVLEPAREPTPMMRQYFEIKDRYKDAILFYRLGDFYEMFYDDAVQASQILDLTLTTRNKNSTDPVPLCGVPYHAAEPYIARLIAQGKKVAICEQVEDPKLAKAVVKREVVRVLSPGVVLEEASLTGKANNFLLCLKKSGEGFSAAVCDVSTGALEYAFFGSTAQILDETARLRVREVLYSEAERDLPELNEIFKNFEVCHRSVTDLYFDADYALEALLQFYRVSSPDALGLEKNRPEIQVLGGLFGYLNEIKVLTPGLLSHPLRRLTNQFLHLDETTLRNLELFRTLSGEEKTGTLFAHLDRCRTPMGSRQLADYLRFPVLDVSVINQRLSAVERFISDPSLLDALRDALGEVADLERIANKFVTKIAHARDMLALKNSFEVLPKIRTLVAQCGHPFLTELLPAISEFQGLAQKIAATLADDPPLSLKDGHLIRGGVNTELDELRRIEKDGKTGIARMEAEERLKTGINSLKIRYNNVFGYYIEVTHTHREKIPERYRRKQTLSNAERFITEELKQYESKVLGASERIKALEYEIFCALRDEIQKESEKIRETAGTLAILDVLQAFADLARKHGYTRPQMTTAPVLHLKAARHPILTRLIPSFVPNDLSLDGLHQQVLVITGPNMAGKSTVMRTAALVVIMAQMGCFVPCASAEIGVCDRIFTRVGAHDFLQKGLSTFMVEMVETAKILREATPRSLILLDEIGRGTSTFDGLSIAWAVAEDIHDRLFARTLFATHYHELCDLAAKKRGIQNFQMSVKERNGEIIFLRTLKPGGTNRSYGVVVAQMAGLPPDTVRRAREILRLLEVKDMSFQSDLDKGETAQIPLFEAGNPDSAVEKRLKEINLDQITPLEALICLSELKKEIS